MELSIIYFSNFFVNSDKDFLFQVAIIYYIIFKNYHYINEWLYEAISYTFLQTLQLIWI